MFISKLELELRRSGKGALRIALDVKILLSFPFLEKKKMFFFFFFDLWNLVSGRLSFGEKVEKR